MCQTRCNDNTSHRELNHRCQDGRGYPCASDATVYLVAPDGERVPGPGMCATHATVVIQEYADKLREAWTTVNVDTYN